MTERSVVKSILEHGDFGLGTFANLDGEMAYSTGEVYQVQGTGRVLEAGPDAGAPFAVVTRFSPQTDVEMEPVASFKDLEGRCDKCIEIRAISSTRSAWTGHFTRVRTSGCADPATARHAPRQTRPRPMSEFCFSDIDGTLIGLVVARLPRAPSASPGYHFHFLSKDRQHGGHLLDVEAGSGAPSQGRGADGFSPGSAGSPEAFLEGGSQQEHR